MDINVYLFKKAFSSWKHFIEGQDGAPFRSFETSKYIIKEENYKKTIYEEARVKLGKEEWLKTDIGTGSILESLIDAIEIKENNLVFTNRMTRINDDAKPHRQLLDAQADRSKITHVEQVIYDFYADVVSDELSFNRMIEIIGKRYPLMGYLFFIKNRRRYTPISPTNFEKAFGLLNVTIKLSHKCSWQNYSEYNQILNHVRLMLEEELSESVQLIDAHTFMWILVRQMQQSPYDHQVIRDAKVVEFDPDFMYQSSNEYSDKKPYSTEDRESEHARAKEIGDRGELYVMETEKHALRQSKFPHLADLVQHVSEQDDSLGYDIKSFDENTGEPKFIEVKSSTSSSDVVTFYPSRNQLLRASKRDNYWLYVVMNVEGNPKLRKIANPFIGLQHITATIRANEVLSVTPINFQIRAKIKNIED